MKSFICLFTAVTASLAFIQYNISQTRYVLNDNKWCVVSESTGFFDDKPLVVRGYTKQISESDEGHRDIIYSTWSEHVTDIILTAVRIPSWSCHIPMISPQWWKKAFRFYYSIKPLRDPFYTGWYRLKYFRECVVRER